MHRTGIEDYYITKNNKRMRFGYTTGTCAAAASKAAALMLVSGRTVSAVDIDTPKGIQLNLEVCGKFADDKKSAICTVIKDSGDDPDVTNGMPVCAKVFLTDDGSIKVDGGEGVGRVTKSGLYQKVGAAAINRVPMQMILAELQKIKEDFDMKEGFYAEIILPMGKELAHKTFNPRLGIEGGLSVLGTSGIVEPMSEAAIVESIRLQLSQKRNQGKTSIIITPGNYGADFIRTIADVKDEDVIKCSNYIGETIDMLCDMEYEEVLFISHIGKFIKVAGGIMNTHSREADCRMEILAANAIKAGLKIDDARRLFECVNTDDCIDLLKSCGLAERTMAVIGEKIDFYINNRSYGKFKSGTIVFSNKHGILCRCGNADEIIRKYER
ncbi:MAG: cobalamin biosynthesis protein CbiD [Firmicutes bacterium]|jgi:cobalt-precorrin-5B (C1)-methyltransferase|nr:cobalamin biosynthesis protein CbiD [Bacillota bacterium]